MKKTLHVMNVCAGGAPLPSCKHNERIVYEAQRGFVESHRNVPTCKHLIMRRLIVLLCLILLGSGLYAQEEKNSIRLSVPVFQFNGIYDALFMYEIAPQLEYSRAINESLSAFAYVGLGFHDEEIVELNRSNGLIVMGRTFAKTATSTALYYGVGFRLHVLPIFGVSSISHRFDPYLSASFGGNYMFKTRKGLDRLNEVSSQNANPDILYSLSPVGGSFDQISAVGLNLYITQRVGLWGELGYRQSRHRVGLHWNAGLAVRF